MTGQTMRRRKATAEPAIGAADAEDARLLALELAGLAPERQIDQIGVRVVLEPGERAPRATVARLWWWQGAWVGGVDCTLVVTDRRLIVRMPDASLGSLWWGSMVGFEADLNRGQVVVDFGDGSPRLLMGSGTAVVAVAGVAALYGIPALSGHPALAPLRQIGPGRP